MRAVWRNGDWCDRYGKPIPNKSDGLQAIRVMSDIREFVSPIDFKTSISSRTQLRDYEKRNGVKQIGTDFDGFARRVAAENTR